ncbi:Highly reducing polyketide synthase gloL [Colletotrichum sp. SAR11_240]|nr:Highly reducing polyketide synthase gloL [Colletotrichum sp. SAR11_240]
MGVRLPGHVHTPADYWDLLVNGRSGQCRVPKSRYNVEAWYGPGRPNHVPTEFGYFLEELNLAHVDPSFWSFTKQEAERMDPRQRLFLEVAYEALQSSGDTKFRGADVGVYVGTMGEDWSQLESRDEQSLEQVRPDVYGDYILANRASYEFDLTGPSVVVRTACSASLVALHMACRDLHGGDCTSAIVGGVNLILTPKDTTVMHQQAGITDLSKTAMVECHGTGTSVGDPIEVGAVANIWGDHGIYIGSVKPNIGHGEGQGAQWAQMGKELLQQNVLVQQTISRLDSVLASLSDPPQWKLKDLLLAPKDQSRLAEAEFSQPCLVAIQVALVDLLRSWGVTPDAVVGHSSGETAAAYASGAITAEDAIRIAYHRGQITLLIKAAHKGSMAAVGLGPSQVQKFLRPGVMIGCVNSPASVTLSGEADVLEDVVKDIMAEHPGVLARSLHVECGYHSQHMKTAEMDFTRRLEGWLQPIQPNIPFYSSVTGTLNNDMSHSYWVRNVVSPVHFSTAVESVLTDFKSAAFVEIGPHSALAGPIRQILHTKGRVAQYVPTLVRNEDAVSCVLKTAGELWSVGARIELAAVTPAGKFLTDLPTYPWHYDKEYWVESRLSRSWRLRKFDHHELLGTRVEEISDACPAWRCNLRVEDVPWIRDHMILGENVFPAAGFVSMIGEALKQLKGSVNYTLGHVTFDSALVLNDRPVELVTVLNSPPPTPYLDSEWYEFSISSLSEGGDTWVRHVTGECKAGSDSGHQAPEVVKLPRKVSLDSFYSTWKRFGLEYGARFRNLADASSHVTEPTAIASLQTDLSDYEMLSYAIHPTALDSSMHFAMVASCRGLTKNFKQMAIPTYIEELYVSRPSGKIHLEATVTENSSTKSSSYITGVSEGETVIDIKGLEVEPVAGSSAHQAEDPHAGAIVEWKPDVDFLDITHIIRHQDLGSCTRNLEKLVLACIVESRAQLQFLPATQPHFVDFKSWLDATYRQTVAGEHQDPASPFDIAKSTPQSRQVLIAEMLEACKGTPTESLALAVHHVYTNAAACFSGRLDAIKEIDSATTMARAAEILCDIDLTSFLQLLGHKRPNMHVLHIGDSNDTAANINKILSALSSDSFGNRLYGNYVYACTSSKFSTPVKDCLRNFSAAKYGGLNTDVDFTSQGLRNESFDVILVFDAASSSRTNLKKIRKLLKSTGRIILGEPNSASRALQYVTGLLPLSENLEQELDIRDQLRLTGFDVSSAVTLFGDYSRLTIARPFSDNWKTDRISIICEEPAHHLVRDATEALRGLGIDLDFVVLGEELPWGQPVVSLLDLEGPFIHGMSPQGWEDLKKTILSAQDEKMLWVTGACQIECKNPNYSLVLGLARTLRRELSMDFVTLELELFDANGWKAMHSVLTSFGQRITGGDVDPESDVNAIDDVAKMVHSANRPIAGLLQAAMVLQDTNITDMTFEQWQTTVDPKVQGTWNLHNALQQHQSEPLDFFFLFSSLSGLGGQIGQANYAAGNAFLDAFVQYRHSKGLACSVLDIGIMEDIGVLAREQNRLEALRATKQHCLHEQDLLDALELMIRRSQPVSEEETHAIQNVDGISSRGNSQLQSSCHSQHHCLHFIHLYVVSQLHTFDHKMQFNAILLALGLLSAAASAETILGCWNGRFTCAGACINKGECKEIQSSDNAWCCVV